MSTQIKVRVRVMEVVGRETRNRGRRNGDVMCRSVTRVHPHRLVLVSRGVRTLVDVGQEFPPAHSVFPVSLPSIWR